MNKEITHIPPLRLSILTPLFDFAMSLIGLGKGFKKDLVAKMGVKDGQSIIDIGCGTGVLAVEAKKMFPRSKVVGIDPDKPALEIAKARAKRENVEVDFTFGSAKKLPLKTETFHVAVSTLAFHHMPAAVKKKAAKEAFRVLKRGGKFCLFDFKPRKRVFWNFWTFFEWEHARDNYEGKLSIFLKNAGFRRVKSIMSKYGIFELLMAEK